MNANTIAHPLDVTPAAGATGQQQAGYVVAAPEVHAAQGNAKSSAPGAVNLSIGAKRGPHVVAKNEFDSLAPPGAVNLSIGAKRGPHIVAKNELDSLARHEIRSGESAATFSSSASTVAAGGQRVYKTWLPPPTIHGSGVRYSVYCILSGAPIDCKLGRLYSVFMTGVILLSIVSLCVQSSVTFRIRRDTNVYGQPEQAFDAIELLVTILFTIEYAVRFLTFSSIREPASLSSRSSFIIVDERYSRNTEIGTPPASSADGSPSAIESGTSLADVRHMQISGVSRSSSYNRFKAGARYTYRSIMANFVMMAVMRCARWVLNPINIIDFVATSPYYVSLATTVSASALNVLRVARLSRLLRLIRLARHSKGLQLISKSLHASLDILGFLFFMLGLVVIFFASAMWYCEQGTYMDAFSAPNNITGYYRPTALGTDIELTPFQSIPESMWYVLETITTVGYGEIIPTSVPGKVIGSVVILIGIIVLALPITVISQNFSAEYMRMQEDRAARRAHKRAASATAAASGIADEDGAGEEHNDFHHDDYQNSLSFAPSEAPPRSSPPLPHAHQWSARNMMTEVRDHAMVEASLAQADDASSNVIILAALTSRVRDLSEGMASLKSQLEAVHSQNAQILAIVTALRASHGQPSPPSLFHHHYAREHTHEEEIVDES